MKNGNGNGNGNGNTHSLGVMCTFADRGGCGEYRVHAPGRAVTWSRERGGIGEMIHELRISDSFHVDATAVRVRGGQALTVRSVTLPPGVDVVSVQRPMSASMLGVLKWLREKRPGVGIVVELDDDLEGVPWGNTAGDRMRRSGELRDAARCLREACKLADVVTVSTPELARVYAGGELCEGDSGGRGKGVVVRNRVPSAMLSEWSRAEERGRGGCNSRFIRADEPLVIGWAGNVSTHPGNLELTSGVLAQFVGQLGGETGEWSHVTVCNVGPREGFAEALRLTESDVTCTGQLPIDQYRCALGGRLDIGLVPLDPGTRFDRCKSGLKALEMMAAGVPVICSDTPEHLWMQQTGAPIWVVRNTRRHWHKAVRDAVGLDRKERAAWAKAGRAWVKKNALIEDETYVTQWVMAWHEARLRGQERIGKRIEEAVA